MASNNGRIIKNLIGVVNFSTTDQFIVASMSQVMVIPSQRKIFMREYSNNMYTTRVFFLANWCMSIILSISYPIITSAISFKFLGFDDSSAGNYLMWLTILLI